MLCAVTAIGLLSGCQPPADAIGPKVEPVEPVVLGFKVESLDEFSPRHYADQNAVLEMGGMKIDVKSKVKTEGQDITLMFIAHDEQVEFEKYRVEPTVILLTETATERFDPPLPLLKKDVSIGEDWDWEGALVSGNVRRASTAAIVTSSQPLFLPSGDTESLKIDVKLKIDSGTASPGDRTLTFWFAPNKGVVKRAFGHAMNRIPAEPRE